MTRTVATLAVMLLVGVAARARAEAAPTLRCADAGDCPESVGWLVRETAGDAISCTAFVIAPDVVATARHCVTTTRRDGSRDRGSRFTVRFAPTDRIAASAHEATVLRTSTDLAISFQSASDWALLRLSIATERRPIEVDRSGIADGTDVVVPSIRDVGPDGAVLASSRCATAQHSLFAPHVDDDLAPVQLLAGCAIGLGSSGAPVIDSEGRVRALVHARDQRAWPWREPVRFPVELAGASQHEPLPIAYASSFVCVDLDGSSVLPPSCDPDAWVARTHRPGVAASTFAALVLARASQLTDESIAEASRVVDARDPREAWTIDVVRDGQTTLIVPTARCLVDRTAPLPRGARIAVVVARTGAPTVAREALTLDPIEACSTDDASIARRDPVQSGRAASSVR